MNHDEWAIQLNALLRAESSDRVTLDAKWQQLLTETETARRTAVTDWHIQQTRGNYSDYLRARNQTETAAEIESQIGDDAEINLRYWQEAAIGAFAQSALDHYDLGNRKRAVLLTQQALKLNDRAEEPSKLHDHLISELRTRVDLKSGAGEIG